MQTHASRIPNPNHRVSAYWGPVFTEFGVGSWSRFLFRTRTLSETDTPTHRRNWTLYPPHAWVITYSGGSLPQGGGGPNLTNSPWIRNCCWRHMKSFNDANDGVMSDLIWLLRQSKTMRSANDGNLSSKLYIMILLLKPLTLLYRKSSSCLYGVWPCACSFHLFAVWNRSEQQR